MALLAASPAFAADWYVKPDGNDSSDGQSWATAFATIQKAVTSAIQLGGYEIWVAEGTYTLSSSIVIPSVGTKIPLKLYGGFEAGALTLDDRDWVEHLTVIDGNGVVESVIVVNDYVDLIDGFTITGGRAGSLGTGGGIDIRGCGSTAPQPVLRNLVIRGNGGDTSHPPSFYEGGGIYIQDCSPWIANVSFSNNLVWGHGGAVFARDTEGTVDTYPTIVNCTFTGNHADTNGGAVYCYYGTGEGLVIRNSVFSGNQAGVTIAQGAGGATWGQVQIVNCAMSQNTSASGGGAVNASTPTTVTNSILWGNTPWNINLACTGDDDLSLQAGSPAIDAGDSTALPFGSTDVVGEARHIDDPAVTDSGYGPPPAIDMGAYERQASTPATTYDLTMAVNGSGSTVPTVGVHTYDRNALVQVQAVPAASWLFTGWTGWVADPGSATTTITMAWDRSVTANFKQVQTLEVDVQGTGTGSVTSTPPGIDCPDVCDAVLDHGTMVTLSASPDPGTVFDGWMGGGCLGTGDCELTMNHYVAVDGLFNLEGACGLGEDVTLEDFTVTWDQAFEACSSLTVGSGFFIEAPADVVFRAGNDVVLTDGFSVGEGATFRIEISPDVGVRAIEVTKTADPTTAYEGDPITYTISVENTGCVDLTEVSLVDDKCSAAPAYQSGDDGDAKLEPAEVWVFECSGPAEADDFVNTATATFQDIFGQEVSDSGQATVTVELAACVGNRYADMGDGTILDCNTDLLWLKDASCADLAGADEFGRGDWSTAVAAAAALADGTCGLSDGSAAGDWRLPAMSELCGAWPGSYVFNTGICDAALGLINDAYDYPTVSNTAGDAKWTEGNPFSDIHFNYYWSSSEYGSSDAWYAYLAYINIAPADKGESLVYIWPVRPR